MASHGFLFAQACGAHDADLSDRGSARQTALATSYRSLRTTLDVQRDVDRVLLARYSPACVLVDENLDVEQFRGRTGAFLEQPPGQPQLNLLRMAREGLAAELPLAVQQRAAHGCTRSP